MNALSEVRRISTANMPPEVWKAARERKPEDEDEKPFLRIDVMWAYLSKKKSADGCKLKFTNLAKVAQIVLVLPHSNAGEERVLSLVRLCG